MGLLTAYWFAQNLNRMKNACERRVSKIDGEISVRLHFSLSLLVQSLSALRAVDAIESERTHGSVPSLLSASASARAPPPPP